MFLGVSMVVQGAGPTLTNAILFVTQVPQPLEANNNVISNVFLGVGAGFGNHLADTLHAPRGGDLWLRRRDGTLVDLTRSLGYGVAGAQHTNGIAVREPKLHWDGTRALFSMVVGAPRDGADTSAFFWQLYEITGLPDGPYSIAKVANQPANFNNVSPCYLADGRIVFASDRPRDGSLHLYPQLDEYNDYPTVTGLWSLDPAGGDLHLLNHTPSGVFSPMVDSFGRLVFIRWDHLVQDRNATDDRLLITTNGTFNFADESANAAYNLNDRVESFPEPRTFDTTNLAALKVNGNAFNSFFPWTMFPDGSGEEILNHLGRHDFLPSFKRSFTNDAALVDFTVASPPRPNANYLNNFYWVTEDPRNPGVYLGVDAPDFGTHAAGQILSITAPLPLNPDQCFITYLTPKTNAGPNAYGVYRNPLPMSDATLVAAFATNTTQFDTNTGTFASPQGRYGFRLVTLRRSGGYWLADQPLTPGLSNTVSYYAAGQLVTYAGPLWELDPVEVAPRPVPVAPSNAVNITEQQVFDEEGVDVGLFQQFLRVNNLALLVSHDVTRRDRADKQQPYNLRIAGTATQTLGTNAAASLGPTYDLSHIQFLQADQRRGYTGGGTIIQPGRRVLATPLHEPAADNVADPAGPAGSVKLADDGSFAALVPARRAMTHQLMDPNGGSVVKERYWITYQPGEIRTCKNCHGINTADQAGNPPPNNKPEALRELLRYWKQQNTASVSVTNVSGTNYLALTFTRRPAVTSITQTVDVSSGLTEWIAGSQYSGTNAVSNTAVTTELQRSGAPAESVTVRDNVPLEAAPRRFMRVRVTAP
jgi:hypothetical protein